MILGRFEDPFGTRCLLVLVPHISLSSCATTRYQGYPQQGKAPTPWVPTWATPGWPTGLATGKAPEAYCSGVPHDSQTALRRQVPVPHISPPPLGLTHFTGWGPAAPGIDLCPRTRPGVVSGLVIGKAPKARCSGAPFDPRAIPHAAPFCGCLGRPGGLPRFP